MIMGEGGEGVFTAVVGVKAWESENGSKFFPGNTSRMSCKVNQWEKKADVMIFYSRDHTMVGYIKYD